MKFIKVVRTSHTDKFDEYIDIEQVQRIQVSENYYVVRIFFKGGEQLDVSYSNLNDILSQLKKAGML
jgi:hypothetical protein